MSMKAKMVHTCTSCRKTPLSKDEVGASKKLLGLDTHELYCIDCLSAYLEVTPEDIKNTANKYFKRQPYKFVLMPK